MPSIEFPPAGVTDVSQSPYLQRLIGSGRVVGRFVTVQVVARMSGFLTGILIVRPRRYRVDLPCRLLMVENTAIGHFTVAKNLDLLPYCGYFNRRQGFVI